MRRMIIVLALVMGTLFLPASANAKPGVEDTQRCVTWHEYYQLKKGMPRAEAERVLDWGGANQSTEAYPITPGHRTYRGCKGHRGHRGTWGNSPVHVKYQNGRVKWTYWFVACLEDCIIEEGK